MMASSPEGNGEVLHTLPEDELSTADESADVLTSLDSNPLTLDGYLYCRKGRSTGHGTLLSRKRFVSLSFENGGSIKVFKELPTTQHVMLESHPTATVLQSFYSKLHRGISHAMAVKRMEGIDICIPADLPWVAKDVENDSCSFVVEIPSGKETLSTLDAIKEHGEPDGGHAMDVVDDESREDETEDGDEGVRPQGPSFVSHFSEDTEAVVNDLRAELKSAYRKGKPLRIYFRCTKGSHEKALWLKAFSKLGRLSREFRKRRTLLGTLTAPLHTKSQPRVRTRHFSQIMLARDMRDLEYSDSHEAESVEEDLSLTNDVEKLVRRHNSRFLKEKEYRVLPTYAYPHRWMTRSEMNEEMVLPSEHFHDLRVPGCKEKEIGTLRVEVLQCLGLPKLDRTSDTDAVVYFVCGSYAFATDIIPNRSNPIWLRQSRRACEFPLFHGYARLYVGVFDDEGRQEKDDFAGRVVIDLARLRPRSTYDVTLPLRLSTHVYSRRKRGAIRLRFTLNWKSERDALLSYIPSSFKIPLPQNSKPNFDTTVNCSDPKAFRNIAITVHGAHLPGRFTFHNMRAGIRELNFTRKYVFTAIRQGFRDARQWQNPAISAFIFCAWMHAVYANAFSLVPAYVVMSFLLYLIRNYVKYGIEGPQKTGFVPPSWEEMFMALLRGGDQDYQIETLELGHRPSALSRRNETLTTATGVIGHRDYRALTHRPQGLSLFRALGFLKEPGAEEDHMEMDYLEFPFADAADYPKFGVKECLVERKSETEKRATRNTSGSYYNGDFLQEAVDPDMMDKGPAPSFRLDMFPIDMHIHDIMRKDSSGLQEYDEEENNFTAGKAVVATGKKAAKTVTKTGMMAATTLTTAATELTEMTGLNHVVHPIKTGISNSSALVSSGVNHVMAELHRSGSAHLSTRPGSAQQQLSTRPGSAQLSTRPEIIRRGHSDDEPSRQAMLKASHSADESDLSYPSYVSKVSSNSVPVPYLVDTDYISSTGGESPDEKEADPALLWPEQNIDIEGPSTGKKLTDDLVDIKDKIHELTWHRFDDYAYVVKNPDAVYFGEARKSEKRRKDVTKQLNKLIQVGQYSHSNPFVARVGLYVEPIIDSVYSFLLLFRAGFNVFTWQDPMLTFWLSLFCGALSLVLFFFPWRHFLFALGFWLVGPQNWVVRVLRERGHLPPLKKKEPKETSDAETDQDDPLATQPVFACANKTQGNGDEPAGKPNVDPREIHSVVVPYSPLMYQRFYDWPPEPMFAQVKPATLDEARRQRALSSLQSVARRSSSRRSESTFVTANRQVPSTSRRLRRRPIASTDGSLPAIQRKRRASTGDWQAYHTKAS